MCWKRERRVGKEKERVGSKKRTCWKKEGRVEYDLVNVYALLCMQSIDASEVKSVYETFSV
jgi:hypothetical protein